MDLLSSLINGAIEVFTNITSKVFMFFPSDFFIDWIVDFTSNENFRKVMGYVNYFFPIGTICQILLTWSVAVGFTYVAFFIKNRILTRG